MRIDILDKKGVDENIQIGGNCTPMDIASFTYLFKEFNNVFALSYEEIPNIDTSIVEHEI